MGARIWMIGSVWLLALLSAGAFGPATGFSRPAARLARRPSRLLASAVTAAAAAAEQPAPQEPRGAHSAGTGGKGDGEGGGGKGKGKRKGASNSCGLYPVWPALPSPTDEWEPAAMMQTVSTMLLSVPLPVMGQSKT